MPCVELPLGGLIAIQSRESVIAMRPDQTNTTVGVFPLLPIKPLAKGYKCTNTQKLKNAPPMNLLH
jgi:hypothetical protein